MQNYITKKEINAACGEGRDVVLNHGEMVHCIVCNARLNRKYLSPTWLVADGATDWLATCSAGCKQVLEINPLAYKRVKRMDSESKTICFVTFCAFLAVLASVAGCWSYNTNIDNKKLDQARLEYQHKESINSNIQQAIQKGEDPMKAYCAFTPDDVNCRVLFAKSN
jgi:hypothetical protein